MPSTTALYSHEASAINNIFREMPYGGMSFLVNVKTVEDVAQNLEKMRDVLRIVAETHAAQEAELNELRRQRDAIRKFLGTEA